jgi:Mrp family chromosome partitioning ATPase/capsular polysaccharide biosynthesis protein
MAAVTIGDLWAALRRHWALSLVIFAVVVGAAIASIVVPEERYESRVVLSVVPPDGRSFDFGGAQVVQYLIPPVLTRIRSEPFERDVRVRLPLGLRAAALQIAAANEPGTGIIEVDVESSVPAAAEAGARAASERVVDEPGSELVRVTELTPATPPESSTAARTPALLGGSVVLGLILAILAAVSAHRLRPPLPRAEGFRNRYGVEILGELPIVKSLPEHAEELFGADGPIEFAAAIRNLEARVMTRLLTMKDPRMKPIVAVTSWGEGEGKSTVTAGLGWVMALLGNDVTVVDLDLRRPRMHRAFGISPRGGVAQLAEHRRPDAVEVPAGPPSLHVIPAGGGGGDPAEVVNRALPALLGRTERYVLLDTPPMFTAETIALTGSVDWIVLVADVRQRRPQQIEEALAELSRAGSPVLGVVLNRVDLPDDDRGQRTYYAMTRGA